MSPHQHVQYILLAEFDIDKGASLTYQYPNETGTDEHILSELMLPDGAHLRAEDWTIFCLNQMIPNPDNEHVVRTTNDNPLLYVLNLVRTKYDATARRGAHVKAMAICTRHQFLHIYKPVLLLAMEKYFEKPSQDILVSLYEAVNSMDLTRMPNLNWHERQVLRASDDKSMFEEMFDDDFEKVQSPISVTPTTDMISQGDDFDTVDQQHLLRRGTFIDLTSGQKVLTALGKDRHFFETKIDYEGIKLPIRVPLTMNDEEVGDFSLIKLISTFSPNQAQPGSPNPHHPHLDSQGPFTHPILLLLNALLTQKRVVFLGYGHPSGEVANYVLAACALGSGCGTVLRGFTERAFPYTNLTSVDDLLKCPGFIAGVTNPTYEEHTAWWDVLCNISTGKITVSKDIQVSAPGRKQSLAYFEDGFASLSIGRVSGGSSVSSLKTDDKNGKERDFDTEFMQDVLSSIQAHYGETSIRAKFQDYVLRFVRLAALYEEQVYQESKISWTPDSETDPTGLLGSGAVFPDDATKQRELAANASRIEGWRQTLSYKYVQRDFELWRQGSGLKNLDVHRQLTKLKYLRNLPDKEVIAIYEAFLNNIVTERQIIEFLSHLPQYHGGLVPLATGLFHSSNIVRQFTVELFQRLERNPVRIYRKREREREKGIDLSEVFY
ncbi:docking domain of Afi1 for Arf3 in vesicle trafficking-domain-containing protein [Halteromyces radiatus]|uniref:docking domain of Afi1 for Arf3 in vesicle trafficking-domain-containing protein n=1 Tax=Halteromyces radiatus TaxID=101107 RepID=UPI0022201EC4|nr:docking domain of Afi1 for Arf3 in vesicle trafficking-domain-containing protein [Halteromyces radiatus]KAI8086293.1 docking domain of Afi1 for Arf3 in vesicle trafficking-domain-containing protein [Halteromyces radiatus]